MGMNQVRVKVSDNWKDHSCTITFGLNEEDNMIDYIEKHTESSKRLVKFLRYETLCSAFWEDIVYEIINGENDYVVEWNIKERLKEMSDSDIKNLDQLLKKGKDVIWHDRTEGCYVKVVEVEFEHKEDKFDENEVPEPVFWSNRKCYSLWNCNPNDFYLPQRAGI